MEKPALRTRMDTSTMAKKHIEQRAVKPHKILSTWLLSCFMVYFDTQLLHFCLGFKEVRSKHPYLLLKIGINTTVKQIIGFVFNPAKDSGA